ncbi:MAG: SDR family NAD(P)-dependent oxidoreductase [Chloroflexi bacterium]|nr:MAG: SDR family NAD(P)-dependent oxidoreductase [Chloroflexota bacterium]
MDLGLTGRVVIVTGGASNLGRAITLGFAAEGARVVIADVDDAQSKKVAGEAPSGTIVARHTDVTDWESVKSTVEFVIDAAVARSRCARCRSPASTACSWRSRATSGSARSRSTCGASSTAPAPCST